MAVVFGATLLALAALSIVTGGGVSPALPEVFRTSPRPQSTFAIPDEDFGPLIDRLSEPEGYFDTDNFISNETSYQHVLGRLAGRVAPGGAYLGVGPDQNFTYIVYSDPALALVVDIRRQNMLQHLLFKILIQESPDRTDFVCLLFSRDCSSASWEVDVDLETMLDRVAGMDMDIRLRDATIERVLSTLETTYRVDLSGQDRERITYVHESFAAAGPAMRFSSFGGNNVVYPTFTELMIETDETGLRAGYLANEARFDRLREFQQANLLVPFVGDFAGDEALASAAGYLAELGLPVSVVYTSNVEYYLFGTDGWDRWVENAGAFTFSEDAVFLRAYFPTYGRPHPENVRGYRPTSLIQSVRGFLEDAASGHHGSYWDVVTRHRF